MAENDDLQRLFASLSNRTPAEPSGDETYRYVTGLMKGDELLDFQAFLDVNESAQKDIADARAQIELQRTNPFPPNPPKDEKRPERSKIWAWLWPSLAFAAMAVAAVAVLDRSGPKTATNDPALVARAESAEAENRRLLDQKSEFLDQKTALEKKLAQAKTQVDTNDEQRKKAEADRALLQSKIAAINGRLARQDVEIAEQLRRENRLRNDLVALRDHTRPAIPAEPVLSPKILDLVAKAKQSPDTLDGGKPALDTPPMLLDPPPGHRSLDASPERLVLSIPAPQDRVPYQWELWDLEGGATPRRRLGYRIREEGGRFIFHPSAKLPPGKYAIGVRKDDPDSTLPEEERRWHTYSFRILTPQERTDAREALAKASRQPLASAATLYGLGRFDDALEVLAKASGRVHAEKFREGIEGWRTDAEKGTDLPVKPDAVQGNATPAVPIDVAIGTPDPQTPPTPLPGDSPEAFKKLFDEAAKLRIDREDRPRRVALFQQAYKMAIRLDAHELILMAGGDLIEDYTMAGEAKEAEPLIVPSAEHARRAMAQVGEPQKDTWRWYGFVAFVCYQGGAAYRDLGKFDQSIALLKEGLDVTRLHSSYAYHLRLNFQLAMTYEAMSDYPNAVATYEDTLKVLAEHPDDISIKSPAKTAWIDEYSSAALSLARDRMILQDFAGVKRTVESALKRADLDPESRTSLTALLANAQFRTGELAAAMRNIEAAKAILREHPNPVNEGDIEFTLGMNEIMHGRILEGRERMKRLRRFGKRNDVPKIVSSATEIIDAIEKVSPDPHPDPEFASLKPQDSSPLGRLMDAQNQTNSLILRGKWDEAAASAERQIDLVKGTGLMGFEAAGYGSLGWCKTQLGHPEKALDDFERAVETYDRLWKQTEPGSIGIVQQQNFPYLYAQYAWTLVKAGRPDDAVGVLDSGRAVGLRALRHGGDRRSRQSIPARIVAAAPKTLFLQYGLVDRDRTLLLVSEAGKPTVGYELAIGTARFVKLFNEWSPDESPQSGAQSADKEKKAARELAAALLKPLEDDGRLDERRYQRLVIVGDGPLQQIPFAALVGKDGKRLIERFAIGYRVALGLEAPAQTSKKPLKSLLAVAYAGRTDGTAKPGDRDVALGALKEVADVARLVPGADVLSGPDARESTVKAELPDYRVILFGGHGAVDTSDPLDSRLVLEPGAGTEDGDLKAREVANLGLNAELAVLSACETAAGGYAGGEGLMGMAWAFQAAGCPSVVATDWRVRDQVSHTLVVDLFRGLKAGLAKDEALRQAALKVMRSPGRSQPYYWAAFKLIGDPSPVRF